ncbi:hypothetical protein SETIT_2G257900v2 [Setaria italica]|uniref:Uncharacterized protein n=1 Tax=Setaria italica TaxID=4555 RepID=A0A368Q4Y6_SETIT|nr:hypothetical protein SETIT_2G257900v2 [Setaria italica]
MPRTRQGWSGRPATHRGTRSLVPVLAVVERVRGDLALPRQPPPGVHDVGDGALHEHHARERLPRPAEVRLHHGSPGGEILVGRHGAGLEAEAAVAVGTVPPLRGDRVLLPLHRQARADVAALEHGRGVAEDEVDGAGDRALPHRLPEITVASMPSPTRTTLRFSWPTTTNSLYTPRLMWITCLLSLFAGAAAMAAATVVYWCGCRCHPRAATTTSAVWFATAASEPGRPALRSLGACDATLHRLRLQIAQLRIASGFL